VSLAARSRARQRLGRLVDRLRGAQNVDSLRAGGASVGHNVRLAQPAWVDPAFVWLISIGDDAILGPGVQVIAHDASTKRLTGYTLMRPVKIGARVYIGASAIILPGVSIGDDAIVGAATVVRDDVPAGTMVVGNPGRVVGQVSDYAARHLAAMPERPVHDVAGLRLLDASDAEKRRMRGELEKGPGYVR